MSVVARQFGRPRGLLGRVIGRGMARGNADFNRWFVHQIRELAEPNIGRIVELGPGPGIALQETLRAFPGARVWGIDPSPEMLSQFRTRNVDALRSGRLVAIEGGEESLKPLAPVDLVLAAHVLYFWRQPDTTLAQIHSALRIGGWLALGYQLRRNMPAMAQNRFPREGYLLYDSDDQIGALLEGAGFKQVRFVVKGPIDAPEGRLAVVRG